jgi:hypothetical protein
MHPWLRKAKTCVHVTLHVAVTLCTRIIIDIVNMKFIFLWRSNV